MSDNPIHSRASDAYIVVFPFDAPQTKMAEPYSDRYLKTSHIFLRADIISIQTSKSKGQTGTWSAQLSPRLNWKSKIQPGCWVMIFMSDQDLTDLEGGNYSNTPTGGLKMLGIVRSVRAVESMDEGGRRHLRYEISGNDFQSVLATQIYVNPDLRVIGNKDSNPIIDAAAFYGKKPNEVLNPGQLIKLILEVFLGKQQALGTALSQSGGKAGGVYGIPPEVALRLTGQTATGNMFVNILQQAIQPDLFGQIAFQPQVGSNFDCWSLLASYQNAVLNELYTDLMPVVVKEGKGKKATNVTRLMPTIVLRAIPFSSPGITGTFTFESNEKDEAGEVKTVKNNLTAPLLKLAGRASKKSDPVTHLYTSKFIGEDEILSMNYGKSDAERFNFFYVSGNYSAESPPYTGLVVRALAESRTETAADGKSTFLSQNPMGDPNSVARHGLRPFFTSTNFITLSTTTAPLVVMNKIVRDMWHDSHMYENGTINIIGSHQHIPVGTNIVFKDRDWIAHVEAVTHSYNVSPEGYKSFYTSISFVRLQKTNGTPIDFAKDAPETKDYQQNITHSYQDVNTRFKGGR